MRRLVSPFGLSDDELAAITSLSAAVPIEHRDGFSVLKTYGLTGNVSSGPRKAVRICFGANRRALGIKRKQTSRA